MYKFLPWGVQLQAIILDVLFLHMGCRAMFVEREPHFLTVCRQKTETFLDTFVIFVEFVEFEVGHTIVHFLVLSADPDFLRYAFIC